MTAPDETRITGRSRLGLSQLRWITIAVPVAAIAVLMHLMAFALREVFQTPLGYLVAVALLVVAAAVFSHLVFSAIERLERRVTRQNARLRVTASVATVLSEAGDQAAASQQLLEDICEPLQADAGVMRLIDARSGAYAVTTSGISEAAERLLGTIPMATDDATLVDDAALHPELREIAEEHGLRSLVLVPLVAHGSSEGTLVVASRDPGQFHEDDRQLLEQIARQIGLACQRSSLLAELVDRNAELRILNDHSDALSAAHETAAVLDVVLGTLVEVSRSQYGEFWLDEAGTLRLAHHSVAGTPDDGSLAEVAEAGEVPLRQPDTTPSERVLGVRRSGTASFEASDGVVHTCLPVRAGGRVLGVVHLVRRHPDRGSDRRRRLLETIADQGGVAVSEARQRARAREVAVLEERGRIAREMHDGLAQVLGYLNTKTYAIRQTLDRGDAAAAALMMSELEEAARDASTDVREGVLALRSTEAHKRELLGSLSEYVEKYQRMSGIRVECHLSADCDALRLSEMAQLQIIRLIQEALSNVRKHSGASKVRLSLTEASGELDIRVDDDGCGFDTSSGDMAERPSFGLQTMRERAEAVGGRLSVTSALGQGTHVNALIPLQAPSTRAA